MSLLLFLPLLSFLSFYFRSFTNSNFLFKTTIKLLVAIFNKVLNTGVIYFLVILTEHKEQSSFTALNISDFIIESVMSNLNITRL